MGNEVKNPNVGRLAISGIFAIGGGVVGGLTAGPGGAAKGFSIGWQVGGVLGRLLIKDPTEPQTSDYQKQTGDYGVAIPIVYGEVRLAGNIIWSTVPKPLPEGERGGGFLTTSEPPEEDEELIYVDFAIGLCEGPIAYVSKIYADENLIWSAAPALSPQVSYDTKIYVGSTTQDIDPYMEADKGVGNMPAYRGTAYIRFYRMNLNNFGNNIPNLTAVVVTSATEDFAVDEVEVTTTLDTDNFYLSILDDLIYDLSVTDGMLNVIDRVDDVVLQTIDVVSLVEAMPTDTRVTFWDGDFLSDIGTVTLTGKLVVDQTNDTLFVFCQLDGKAFFVAIPSDTLVPTIHSWQDAEVGKVYYEGIMLDTPSSTSGLLYVMEETTQEISWFNVRTNLSSPSFLIGTMPGPVSRGYTPVGSWVPGTATFDSNGIIWWIVYDTSSGDPSLLLRIYGSSSRYEYLDHDPSVNHVIYNKTQNCLVMYGGTGFVLKASTPISFTGSIGILSIGLVKLTEGYQRANALSNMRSASDLLNAINNDGSDAFYMVVDLTGVPVESSSVNFTEWSLTPAECNGGGWDALTYGLWVHNTSYLRLSTNGFSDGAVTEGAIIQDIMLRSGLTTSDINTAQLATLTTPVTGYVIGRVTSAAAALGPILKNGFLEVLEEDGKLRAKKQVNTLLSGSDLDRLYSPPERGLSIPSVSAEIISSTQLLKGSGTWSGFTIGSRYRVRGDTGDDDHNFNGTLASITGVNTILNFTNIKNLSGTDIITTTVGNFEIREWVPFPIELKEFGVKSEDKWSSETSEDVQDPSIIENRESEIGLPTRITITFTREGSRQVPGSQGFSRSTHPLYPSINLDGEVVVDVPVVMTTQQARQLAKKSLVKIWSERSSYEYTMGFRWMLLNVGDVLQIPFNDLNQLVRVTDSSELSPFVKGFKATQIQGNLNSLQTPADSEEENPDDSFIRPSMTVAHYLDSHMIRPVDNNVGWYAVGYPKVSARPWDAATILYSTSLFGGYPVGNIYEEGTVGTLLSSLPDASPEDLFDETLVIRVKMRNDTLASHTEEEVLNGANLCSIGKEYLAFKTVTSLGSGIFELTGILRYQFGTKPLAGAHTFGETFILFDFGTFTRVATTEDDIGTTPKLRAVTVGLDRSRSYRKYAPQGGTALMCHRPAPYPEHYMPTDNTKPDFGIFVCFAPCPRYGGQWVDGADAPMVEATESYEIEVYLTSDDSLLRTLTATDPNLTGDIGSIISGYCVYTREDQTTDLGHFALNEEVYFKIYQISEVMGRGYPLTVTYHV